MCNSLRSASSVLLSYDAFFSDAWYFALSTFSASRMRITICWWCISWLLIILHVCESSVLASWKRDCSGGAFSFTNLNGLWQNGHGWVAGGGKRATHRAQKKCWHEERLPVRSHTLKHKMQIGCRDMIKIDKNR